MSCFHGSRGCCFLRKSQSWGRCSFQVLTTVIVTRCSFQIIGQRAKVLKKWVCLPLDKLIEGQTPIFASPEVNTESSFGVSKICKHGSVWKDWNPRRVSSILLQHWCKANKCNTYSANPYSWPYLIMMLLPEWEEIMQWPLLTEPTPSINWVSPGFSPEESK